MSRLKVMCRRCPHPRDQHSIYRPKCLIKSCPCTEYGGRSFELGLQNGES